MPAVRPRLAVQYAGVSAQHGDGSSANTSFELPVPVSRTKAPNCLDGGATDQLIECSQAWNLSGRNARPEPSMRLGRAGTPPRPSLEPPPPLEQVCAGRPHRSLRTRRCASAASATLRGWSVSPAARSRRLDRKPWGTVALPSRWSSPERAVTPGGIPRTPGRRACCRDRVPASAVGRRREGASLPLAGRRLWTHLREHVKDRKPPTSPHRAR